MRTQSREMKNKTRELKELRESKTRALVLALILLLTMMFSLTYQTKDQEKLTNQALKITNTCISEYNESTKHYTKYVTDFNNVAKRVVSDPLDDGFAKDLEQSTDKLSTSYNSINNCNTKLGDKLELITTDAPVTNNVQKVNKNLDEYVDNLKVIVDNSYEIIDQVGYENADSAGAFRASKQVNAALSVMPGISNNLENSIIQINERD